MGGGSAPIDHQVAELTRCGLNLPVLTSIPPPPTPFLAQSIHLHFPTSGKGEDFTTTRKVTAVRSWRELFYELAGSEVSLLLRLGARCCAVK